MPKGIYKRTPEMKTGKHLNHKGFLGKHTEQTKIKIGLAQKGKKLSEETKRKMKLNPNRSGKGHYNWKDGVTPENRIIRNRIEACLWREAVFARDNWTCQKCGNKKSGSFNAHHIQNFAEVIELRTSIENGITFCEKCHDEFHKIYGFRNNTKEQINKFLIKD